MNKRKLQYVALLIAVLLIAIISLANMQTVTVNFLLVQFKLPLIILILVCVLLGSLVTFLVSLPKNFSLKHESNEMVFGTFLNSSNVIDIVLSCNSG